MNLPEEEEAVKRDEAETWQDHEAYHVKPCWELARPLALLAFSPHLFEDDVFVSSLTSLSCLLRSYNHPSLPLAAKEKQICYEVKIHQNCIWVLTLTSCCDSWRFRRRWWSRRAATLFWSLVSSSPSKSSSFISSMLWSLDKKAN